MNNFTFYATFGHGQPGFPGYKTVEVSAETETEAEEIARTRVREATDNKFCHLHNSIDKVHELDRVFRGEI